MQMSLERSLGTFYLKGSDDLIVWADGSALPLGQNVRDHAFHPFHVVGLIAVEGMVEEGKGCFYTDAIANFHN